MDPDHHSAHNVYLLRSAHTRRTYVGYSPDPYRRLRQHNGEIAQVEVLLPQDGRGNLCSSCAVFVPSTVRSLSNTRGKSRIRAGKRHACGAFSCVRRRALSLLLEHGVLGHEPLSVCEQTPA
jgi:hypothetical protein